MGIEMQVKEGEGATKSLQEKGQEVGRKANEFLQPPTVTDIHKSVQRAHDSVRELSMHGKKVKAHLDRKESRQMLGNENDVIKDIDFSKRNKSVGGIGKDGDGVLSPSFKAPKGKPGGQMDEEGVLEPSFKAPKGKPAGSDDAVAEPEFVKKGKGAEKTGGVSSAQKEGEAAPGERTGRYGQMTTVERDYIVKNIGVISLAFQSSNEADRFSENQKRFVNETTGMTSSTWNVSPELAVHLQTQEGKQEFERNVAQKFPGYNVNVELIGQNVIEVTLKANSATESRIEGERFALTIKKFVNETTGKLVREYNVSPEMAANLSDETNRKEFEKQVEQRYPGYEVAVAILDQETGRISIDMKKKGSGSA
jgi:hypothetical protein